MLGRCAKLMMVGLAPLKSALCSERRGWVRECACVRACVDAFWPTPGTWKRATLDATPARFP